MRRVEGRPDNRTIVVNKAHEVVELRQNRRPEWEVLGAGESKLRGLVHGFSVPLQRVVRFVEWCTKDSTDVEENSEER